MSSNWIVSLLAGAVIVIPLTANAHGDEGDGVTIDQHHSELKTELQQRLGPAYDEAVIGLESADITAGRGIYEQQCSTCHGTGGKGDGSAAASLAERPSDLTNGVQMKFISDAGFMEVIRNGLEDAGMPAYGATLTDDQLLQVYAYTKTLRVETSETDDSHACSAAPLGAVPSGAHWVPLLLAVALLAIGRSRQLARSAG